MRRSTIILAVLLVAVSAFVAVTISLSPDTNAPEFIPLSSQPAGPFARSFYNFGGVMPVRDGKVWIWTMPASTNGHIQNLLYDLDRRAVVGELLHAGPVFANRDQTRLLCEGYAPAASLRWKLQRWLGKFPAGKALAQKLNPPEVFWILDLQSNHAVRLGQAPGPGAGSSFVPSPDFRYGFNKPSTSLGEPDVFLCDLESNKLVKIQFDGDPSGWWDEQNILFRDAQNNFKLFDVVTRRTNTLFTASELTESLHRLNLASDPAALGAYCHWNGREYDLFFTEAKEKNFGESFILKTDKESRTLKLLYRNFKFRWLGHLDSDATHYLYSGERGLPGQGGNGAVYLRNLTNNTTRTLVEPDNRGQYALCRFCNNGVIYWKNYLLWHTDLDGTNDGPLLAPSPK